MPPTKLWGVLRVLSLSQYQFLESLLRSRPIHLPVQRLYSFGDGHVPRGFRCGDTALHLEQRFGWQARLGIQWVDKSGHLLPWPHMINWVEGKLVDYSVPVRSRKLGFSTFPTNDADMFTSLTEALRDPVINPIANAWADPFLKSLEENWREHVLHCYRRTLTTTLHSAQIVVA